LSYGQCVDLGVLVLAKLVSVRDKWLKKLVLILEYIVSQGSSILGSNTQNSILEFEANCDS